MHLFYGLTRPPNVPEIVSITRVNELDANRGDKRTWPFDYEWYLSLESSAGRTSLGIAVQLGAILLAMRKFDWIVFVDHDAWLGDNEPTEFRSRDAVVEHIKRVLVGHPQAGWILGSS